MTLDQYLALLDALGRIVRQGKRGFIPDELPPILERLNIDTRGWLDSLWNFFNADLVYGAELGVSGGT